MSKIKNFILQFDFEKAFHAEQEKNQWVWDCDYGYGGDSFEDHSHGELKLGRFKKKILDYISLLSEGDLDYDRNIGVFLLLLDEENEYLKSVKLFSINVKEDKIITE